MAKKKINKRPSKIDNILPKIIKAIDSDQFIDVVHAQDRQKERNITRPEYLYVLKTGRHEKSKDDYKEEYKSWNYAIRGLTIDRRELRVIISFDESGMLIITVIDLELK